MCKGVSLFGSHTIAPATHVGHTALCLYLLVVGCWIAIAASDAASAQPTGTPPPPKLPPSNSAPDTAPPLDNDTPLGPGLESTNPPASDLPPIPEPAADTPMSSAESSGEQQSKTSGGGTDASVSAHSPDSCFLSNLIGWVGKFHQASVNFPIGLISFAALAELLFIVTCNPRFRFTARFSIWGGAVGALVSVTLGWFLAGFHLVDPSWIRTTHRWLGTSAALIAAVTLVASEMRNRREHSRMAALYRPLLFAVATLILTTGFFGGALVFGLNHYAWPTTAANSATPGSEPIATAAKPAVVVQMTDDWTFDPSKVTIKAGDTVLWKCGKSYSHTVTCDPSKAKELHDVHLPPGAATFNSGLIHPHQTYSHTFVVPGHYRYFCIPHEAAGMIGEVEVKP